MDKLPNDICRCTNTFCQHKFRCLRYMDKGNGERVPMAAYPTPKMDQVCPQRIEYTPED